MMLPSSYNEGAGNMTSSFNSSMSAAAETLASRREIVAAPEKLATLPLAELPGRRDRAQCHLDNRPAADP